MSYAIVKVGGKQYRVEEGQSILVDRMRADEGDKVDLQAVVTGHERGKKIHGLKFKPKRGYKRRYGARSHLTRLEISSIKTGTTRKKSDGS
jgi:large subunit ribosomal protein L21